MHINDQQLGTPQALYKGTQAAIEALTGVPEGAIAYATDNPDAPIGFYDGAAWTWGGGSGAVDSVNGQTGVVVLGAVDVGAQPSFPLSYYFGSEWNTGISYSVGSKVWWDYSSDSVTFHLVCIDAHTSGSSPFDDAGKWEIVSITRGTQVSDTAYDESTWNGVTQIAPSKNAVRDKVESMMTALAAETTTTLWALIGSAGDATPNDTDFVATSLTAGGILKKITWTNVKAFLKTYWDTLYAPIAKGVTNGDSHNHVGGDGAVLYFYIPLPAHGLSGTIAGSSSAYAPPFQYGLVVGNPTNFSLPRGGTLKNFRWNTNSAQPGTGSLVATVRVNNADSALTATVAAGGAAQQVTDLTHTVSVNGGDAVTVRIVNNATGASATIGGLSFELEVPTG